MKSCSPHGGTRQTDFRDESGACGSATPPSRSGYFDPPTGHSGASSSRHVCRLLKVSDAAFTRGLTAANPSGKADVLTLGMNWYPNPYVKWMLNFDRTVFDGSTSGARVPENTLALRAQLGF